MVESDVLITDPQLLSLLASKQKRVKRQQRAAERLKVIRKNVAPKEGKRPRLRALKQNLDTVLTQIMGSTNPGVDLCLEAKAHLWRLNDVIESSLQAHRWLRRHG